MLRRQVRCISRLNCWKIMVISRRAARSSAGRQLLHLAAVDNRPCPASGRSSIVDAPHQRGLAGAGHADDTVDVAILNGQVNIIQRDDRTALRGKAFGQVLQFDHGSLPLFFTKIANGRQNPFAINFTLHPGRLQGFLTFSLEDRHNGTVVGVVDEVLDGVAGQG